MFSTNQSDIQELRIFDEVISFYLHKRLIFFRQTSFGLSLNLALFHFCMIKVNNQLFDLFRFRWQIKKYKYFEKWSDINCIYWNFTCNIYKKYFITFCSLNFIIRTVHSEINIKFFFILLHINHGLCRENICDPENEPKTQRVKVIREQVHANNKVVIDWGN